MKRITFLLLPLLFTACTPESLEIDLPQLEPQTVVFSQVFPDQYFTMVLTKTLDALDFNEEEGDSLTENVFNDLLLTGAYATISYRDQSDPLLEIARGVYGSIRTPLYVNETYTLEIFTPDGKELRAESQVLPKVDFVSIKPQIDRQAEDTLVSIDFEIDDLPGDNWYLLHFYTNRWEDINEASGLDSLYDSSGNFLKRTELVDDQYFAGEKVKGSIELNNVHYSDSLFVTLSNISEDYFRFLEVRKTASSLFTEITREPVNSPSNVEGGLGFFNMHFPIIRGFDLEEF